MLHRDCLIKSTRATGIEPAQSDLESDSPPRNMRPLTGDQPANIEGANDNRMKYCSVYLYYIICAL